MDLESFITNCYENVSTKTFFSIIRDILTNGKLETKKELIENQTELNDKLYNILKNLSIDDNIIKFRCLIRIPKKEQKEEIKEKQSNKAEYYKKYYELHKDEIINKNLERYYKKKQCL